MVPPGTYSYMVEGIKVKVLSANCQGLQDSKKCLDVLNYFKESNAGIICLQDTHWKKSDESKIRQIWNGDCVFSSYSSNSRGVCILFKNNFEYQITSEFKDTDGRIAYVDLKMSNFSVRLISIYAPNKDCPNWYDDISAILDTNDQDYVFICGDFNIALDPEKDTYNYKHVNNPQSRRKVLDIMSTYNLKDAFRHFNPETKHYTWKRKNPLQFARLDYFLVSHSLTDLISNASVKPSYRSDHSVIEINLIINKFKKGKGVWKFNCKLLSEQEYLKLVKSVIKDEISKYAVPIYSYEYLNCASLGNLHLTIADDLFLETLLLRLRGETIKYASVRKKNREATEKQLMSDIEYIEKSGRNRNMSDILEDKKRELEEIRQERMQGVATRARIQWLKEGEKPTRFFCSLEKRNFIEKTVKCLKLKDGECIHDQKRILAHIRKFYQNLFSKIETKEKDIQLNEFFKNLNIKKLTKQESDTLEGNLTIEEIGQALKQMQNNKCPGIDGFPSEFFKVFWYDLKTIILRALNYAYEKGEFSTSLRSCIISCIPKGDKPREYLKNWRPISLLAVPYKIASLAIANRLKTVLDTLISRSQSGFISGRFIGDSTRLVYDIMYYLESNNIEGLLMLIDFEKAFDSVSWPFLYSVLDFFKFGPGFKTWIKTFNTNIQAYVLQMGFLSDSFLIERGCRQGDPISPYLFLLCAQVLFLMIVNDKEIRGITVNKHTFKISQFADDTTLILDGSKRSLLAAMNTLEIFGSISGLKLNTEKTKLVWLGKKRHSQDKIETNYKLEWNVTEFRLLGLTFCVDLGNMPSLNFDPLIPKITKILSQWKKRSLTPLGKITVLKTLILSNFIHLFTTLPSPSGIFLQQLNTIFFSFLWDSKPEKISRKIVKGDYKYGGLKMVDISNFMISLKLSWLQKIFKDVNPPWKTFVLELIDYKGLFLFGSHWSKLASLSLQNPFWKEVFSSWNIFLKTVAPINDADKLSVPLWYNENISKETMYFANWAAKGILFPADIIQDDGKLMTLTDIQTHFDLSINFLDYHRVKLNLNKFIKCMSVEKFKINKPCLPYYLKYVCGNVKSKTFYRMLTQNCENNALRLKWATKLAIPQISNENWQCYNTICFKTIRDHKFIWFQYRLLNRILGTRSYLIDLISTFGFEKTYKEFCGFVVTKSLSE